ncbi:MAG: cell division protein ZapB [Spirochaetaceae bacterium]|nr:cell division protein ZapB [Spirochaetaceae bacterium]
MITLDQVLTLEQKVESAVVKIQQLQAENDALRKQCAELTNALSSKSEQLSSFESNQSQIESGILNALDRLNQIENSVLKVAGQDAVQNQTQPQIIQNTVTIQNNQPVVQTTQSFNTLETVQETVEIEPPISSPVSVIEQTETQTIEESTFVQNQQEETFVQESYNPQFEEQSSIMEQPVEIQQEEPTFVQNDSIQANNDFSSFQQVEPSFSSNFSATTPEETFNEEYDYSEDDSEDTNNLGFDIF